MNNEKQHYDDPAIQALVDQYPELAHFKFSKNTEDWVVTSSDKEAVARGCFFDLDAALVVLVFFIKFIRHIDGPYAGDVFIPLPWQWERIIAPAFGWKMPDGWRRFREVEVWIPKKNGKTTLMAALMLYTLVADREIGARCFSAAADRNQAGLLFDAVNSMVKNSPALDALLVVNRTIRRVDCLALDSYYQVLSADAHRNEGHNIHALFFDELHTQKDRRLWGALRYGSAARKQGIRFVLSTAGELNETSLWWERFHNALAIQDSKKIDIHLLPCVYALRPGENWRSEEVWKRVNPSWGVTVNPVEFRRDYESCSISGANESEFMRYHLNKPTRSVTAWIPYNYWERCIEASKTWRPPEGWNSIGQRVHIGVDLADTLDLVAVVGVWEELDASTNQHVICVDGQFWAPEDAGITTNQGNRERYLHWFEKGILNSTPGSIIPNGFIERNLLEYYKDSQVADITIDRFNAARFRSNITQMIYENGTMGDPEELVKLIGYNAATVNEPTRFLAELIVSGRLRIKMPTDVFDWMFGNLRAKTDSSGNIKLDKGSSANKIDGFSALVLALHGLVCADPEFRSRYETEGLSVMEILL
jgi:phage terminase large subunit-like protein